MDIALCQTQLDPYKLCFDSSKPTWIVKCEGNETLTCKLGIVPSRLPPKDSFLPGHAVAH